MGDDEEIMACLQLDEAQSRTLHEMGIHHPHRSVRQRAQALQQLARGETLAVVSTRFGVHLNSVENWARWWRLDGIVGLFQPARPGRPPKWNATRQQALAELAQQRSGGAHQLLAALGATDICDDTARRYLQAQGLRYKRCRYDVKKSAMNAPFGGPKRSLRD